MATRKKNPISVATAVVLGLLAAGGATTAVVLSRKPKTKKKSTCPKNAKQAAKLGEKINPDLGQYILERPIPQPDQAANRAWYEATMEKVLALLGRCGKEKGNHAAQYRRGVGCSLAVQFAMLQKQQFGTTLQEPEEIVKWCAAHPQWDPATEMPWEVDTRPTDKIFPPVPPMPPGMEQEAVTPAEILAGVTIQAALAR